jgi:TRAP-type C4-dicarboxylate transport system substrate-binding protein
MKHHIQQTQQDFARLVAIETNGEVDLQILEGKRKDIPVFNMPEMTAEGSLIQASAVPSFFLPRVSGPKIFEIPYLFRDKAHAAKYPESELARVFSAQIEDAYNVKVLGHFLVAHNVSFTSTDKPMVMPMDFAGRHINDDFESFAPMWVNVKPAKRYSIGFTEAAAGALHAEKELDTSIGMLQNNVAQKQYTKFHYATIAPGFYTFFYTFVINRDVWAKLSDAQQAGIMRAARGAEKLALVNEEATAIHHIALNEALGVNIHRQTASERDAWRAEFSGKVRDGILQQSDNPGELRTYIEMVEAL